MTRKIEPFQKAKGEMTPPGDKSITHRGVLFSGLAKGVSRISRPLLGKDCKSSMACLRALGVGIEEKGSDLLIQGVGLHGLQEAKADLDAGNSGTTMRLLSGILAGQKFSSRLTGDHSLQSRPMNRVILPLRAMGGRIESFNDTGRAPLSFKPAELKGVDYVSPVASAQVKSAILLAGLYATGETIVEEPSPSRDHSERILKAMGADLCSQKNKIRIQPADRLNALDLVVPGDISSAAFFVTLGLLAPGSQLLIRNVGLNPGRTGFIRTVIQMGGRVKVHPQGGDDLEPFGDIEVYSSQLKGINISRDEIPSMIDELPLVGLCAALAEGETRITGAAELRVKESDRIESIASTITALGGKIQTQRDGFVIQGMSQLKGGEAKAMGDHRIAMLIAIGGALSQNGAMVIGDEAADISYPGFFDDLESLRA